MSEANARLEESIEAALARSLGISLPGAGRSKVPMPADELSHAIVGAAIDVHRCLGPGLLESVYEKALMIELEHRGLKAQSQAPITLEYRGHSVGEFLADIVVESSVMLELKAVNKLNEVHVAQILSYLRATGLRLGLLLNFNCVMLCDGLRRIVL